MTQRMSCLRAASATSGSRTGVTTKAAPASLASSTTPGSQTVPRPIGVLPPVLASRPWMISKWEGTLVVTSTVPMPPSIAARQAWKASSGFSVRITPATRLGKARSMVSTALELSPSVPAIHPRDQPGAQFATRFCYTLVHTYDRGGDGGGDPRRPARSDRAGGRRIPPRRWVRRHQRPLHRLSGRRGPRQPPVLLPHQVRAPGGSLALPDRPLGGRAQAGPEPAHRPAGGPGSGRGVYLGLAAQAGRHPAGGLRPPGAGAPHRAPPGLPAGAVHPLPRANPGAARPPGG